jgi:ParB family chromosome partitioning protein
MAKEAERLLDGTGWLPEPLRTPVIEDPGALPVGDAEVASDTGALPAFLNADGHGEDGDGALNDEEDPSATYAEALE